jgi:hypothetical protein
MLLNDYMKKNQQKKIDKPIIQRWDERIKPRQLWTHGREGAHVYCVVLKYGTGIGVPKLLQFGQLALNMGYPEFAASFFIMAAGLEGVTLEDNDISISDNPMPKQTARLEENHPQFPEDMQPGHFVPMQPEDAKHEPDYYIRHPGYWGQRKRMGQKLIVFASEEIRFYQSREGNLSEAPDRGLDAAFAEHAKSIGSFIVEGEFVYHDIEGNEFQTGSEAAKSNLLLGNTALPTTMYYIFNCVWLNKMPLLDYGEMTNLGQRIATCMSHPMIGNCFIFHTPQAKQELLDIQLREGREGEVWFDPTMSYTPGKNKKDIFIRTKHLLDVRPYTIMKVFPSTAKGHTISGFSIMDENGNDLGRVGTGYNRSQQREILERFEAGQTDVLVKAQRKSVYGKLIHARFAGFPKL